MPNLKFSFLYRDAANYKTFGELVFANPENIPLEDIRKTILSSCNSNGNFDPRRWNIPNLRTQPYDPELDHDWYEYAGVEETEDSPTDERTAAVFLAVATKNPLSF